MYFAGHKSDFGMYRRRKTEKVPIFYRKFLLLSWMKLFQKKRTKTLTILLPEYFLTLTYVLTIGVLFTLYITLES